MSRGVLVIGGLVVAGAVVALVVMLGGGGTNDGAGHAKTQTSDASGTSGTTTPQGPRPTLNPGGAGASATPGVQPSGSGAPPVATGSNAPIVTPRDQPRGAGTADAPAGAQGSSALPPERDYSVGDIRMRDHRSGSHGQADIPPNVHTPEGPRIDSALTAAIGRQVKIVMLECAKGTSREGRGAEPRVEGQVVIAVKANQASVLSGIMQPRDVSPEVATTIKTCVETKLVGLTAPAPNQADLDHYSINMSMKLP